MGQGLGSPRSRLGVGPGSPHLQEAGLAAERGAGHEGSEGFHAQAPEDWQSLVQVAPPTHRKVD